MEQLPHSKGSDNRWSWEVVLRHAVPLSVLVAGVMVSASILYVGSDGAGTEAAALGDLAVDEQPAVVDHEGLIDDDPMLGDPDAPVTIVEFSDFQCPFCRRYFTDTFPEIKAKYIDTGIANLVFRDFPLSFHSAARPSAIAAECADEQGKFWEYHDKVFLEQAEQSESSTVSYGTDDLKRWAREVGIDGGRFDQCLDAERYADEVEGDFEDGQAAGVSGTPTFFVNGTLLVGAQPFTAFEQAIEAAR